MTSDEIVTRNMQKITYPLTTYGSNRPKPQQAKPTCRANAKKANG